ncbi:hypothetical protein [Lacipirellula limnantheis]|uniref:Uncharacterized protein n=1 Tax=Lacipirellula limnantheis TaxID=2528024 RepID=A0A517U1P1_9BACT|nr:hypothetical protein [Lacipirellula limnantheis]QDT74545.1 hypothetical protein I41_37420 [Lacipirellula limnantheis]
MRRDFEIKDGIYLSQSPHELDLHNNFDFCGLHYSVEHRTLSLHWRRSTGDGVAGGTPASVSVEFREVSEFRFLPRDAELPFTEDDCVNTWGYWTDEEWADGVIMTDPTQAPDPQWLTGIHFMSGATIAVQASSAHATITA